MSTAEDLAEKLERGEADVEKETKIVGGSGKNRTKLEQHEHKRAHAEGDTRKIVTNATNSEEKRREEEQQKKK